MKLAISTAIVSALAKAETANAASDYYTYYGEYGPDNWATLDVADNQCGGTNGSSGYGQSPVTVSSDVAATCDTDMSAYTFTGGDCTWSQLKFSSSNNGVKVEPAEGADCSFGTMTIPHTNNPFNALQFHIHTSSEHVIEGAGDGGYFPAELHVVHQESTGESYAVFGTMIDVGDEDHPTFEYFLQGWEAAHKAIDASCGTAEGRRGLAEVAEPVQTLVQCPAIGSTTFADPSFPDEAPNLYELPTSEFGVFTYKGGLTTPACTEIVNWNLLDTPMLISQSQLERLQVLIMCYIDSESCHYATVADESGSTSRPPQDLKGRVVTHRCPDGPADVVIVDVGEQPSTDVTSTDGADVETEAAKDGNGSVASSLASILAAASAAIAYASL